MAPQDVMCSSSYIISSYHIDAGNASSYYDVAMKIALVPMSAKPFHCGHHNLILTAAGECSTVEIYVSLSPRENIKSEMMQRIWPVIESILPDNVAIIYGGSPVRNVWSRLGSAFEDEAQDKFVIYGGKNAANPDDDDIEKRFSNDLLVKYVPDMFQSERVKTRKVDRLETGGISGQLMRTFLKENDEQAFKEGLPNAMSDLQKQLIWDELSKRF